MSPEDDSALRALLQSVGRRPSPPEAVSSAVYEHTRRAWELQLRRRQLMRRGFGLAVGLVLALVVGRFTWQRYPHQVVAAAPQGQAIEIRHTIWHPFASRLGGNLYSGDRVYANAVSVRLQRPDGSELRLAHDTRLAFTAPDRVTLQKGQLYVQTLARGPSSHLIVLTDLGRIEHLGTRFIVQAEPSALLVEVREGRVALHYGRDQAIELQAGQAAHVDPQGMIQNWELDALDSSWNWADAMSAPLAIDGQSLYAVLAEIAHRAGLALRFASPGLEFQARGLSLHGADLDLPLRSALAAVLATTSLAGATSGREILISARR